MFLMAFYAMHKPKNEVEKMKHKKKPNLPKPMDGQFAFQMLYLPKRAFFHHLILIATLKVVNPTI